MPSNPNTTNVFSAVYTRDDLEHLMRKDQSVLFRDGITFRWSDYDEVEMLIPKEVTP